MKFKILLFFVLCIIAVSCSKTKRNNNTDEEADNDKTARVVGYLPASRFYLNEKIDYCKLTHLNLAFANPDSDGNIIMPSIAAVASTSRMKNPNIIVCISLAGGVLTSEQSVNWSNLIDIPVNRPAFIKKIVDYVLDNNLDGVDVDLEWNHVTSGYSDFVIELGAALHAHNKIITVAFPKTRFSNVTDAALQVFDFINIMSYDATGPWNPSSPGQHSSFNYSKEGMRFWNNTVGISKEKLTLGVPFYGYSFVNSTTAHAVTYSEMVSNNVNNADLDQVGSTYYNGRPTIASKVNLVVDEKLGGIMIWELGQDAFNDYSLLKTIHEKFTELGVKTSGLCGN